MRPITFEDLYMTTYVDDDGDIALDWRTLDGRHVHREFLAVGQRWILEEPPGIPVRDLVRDCYDGIQRLRDPGASPGDYSI